MNSFYGRYIYFIHERTKYEGARNPRQRSPLWYRNHTLKHTRRMVALPPRRCRAKLRAYIAALQSNAVPGNEQRAASSEQRAASMRAFIINLSVIIITFCTFVRTYLRKVLFTFVFERTKFNTVRM